MSWTWRCHGRGDVGESDQFTSHSAIDRRVGDKTISTTRAKVELGANLRRNSCRADSGLRLALHPDLAPLRNADRRQLGRGPWISMVAGSRFPRSEGHTSEPQSRFGISYA